MGTRAGNDGLERVERALAGAISEQRAHEQYRREHQRDLDHLAGLEQRISQRLDQLADALTERPPHLEQLGLEL